MEDEEHLETTEANLINKNEKQLLVEKTHRQTYINLLGN